MFSVSSIMELPAAVFHDAARAYLVGCIIDQMKLDLQDDGLLVDIQDFPETLYDEALKKVSLFEVDQMAESLYRVYNVSPLEYPLVGYAFMDAVLQRQRGVLDAKVFAMLQQTCREIHEADEAALAPEAPPCTPHHKPACVRQLNFDNK